MRNKLFDNTDMLNELRSTLGRIELVFSLIGDSIVWTDGKGLIQWCNASFDHLVDKPHIEVLGSQLIRLMPFFDKGQQLPIEKNPISLALGSRRDISSRHDFKKANQSLVLEVVAKSALFGEDEPTTVFVFRDVTERVQKEDALFRLNTHLEAAIHELESINYSLSHDLRTPLRSIDGFSQALLDAYSDKLDTRGQDYLHRVRAGAQKMSVLFDDILRLSNITRVNARGETVSLSQLAHTIVDNLQRTNSRRHVDVIIQNDLIVHGDLGLLRHAFENLLGNAWKFTSMTEHARIEFGSREQTGEFVYFVRDNGCGFDMKYSDKLFGAFQKLHTTSEFTGTGIGLAIVERIIRRHGGRIWAEGAVGKGAVFYFTLGNSEITR